MNWWMIYTEAGAPYMWSFDSASLPPGPLKHRLQASPLMFRAFTTQQLADQFIAYVGRTEGTKSVSRSVTRQELVSELRRLQSEVDPPVEWFCVDEQPGLNSGAGTPVNIETFARGS